MKSYAVWISLAHIAIVHRVSSSGDDEKEIKCKVHRACRLTGCRNVRGRSWAREEVDVLD
jgi:hypothetical protein